MKTRPFPNYFSSILLLSLSLIIYPVSSRAGVVDIHFVELDEGGITVKIFYSGSFGPPAPVPANVSFPGDSSESASVVAGAPGVSHIGMCGTTDLVFNVLEAAGGPISDQIIVHPGCGDPLNNPTKITFVSDSEDGLI